MPAIKNLLATVVLSTALLCFGAAGAADPEFAIQTERLPAAHVAQLQCRIYFGCPPLAWLPAHRPLNSRQE